MDRHIVYAILLMLVAPSLVAAQGAGLGAGDALAPFDINDQHDKADSIDEDVRLIMFSRDMTANKVVKKAFMERPGDYLPVHHAMYMIDVSGMPKFVTRNFAVPKMRKYPYRIFLDRDASLTTALPSQKKRVTLVHLDKLKITGIEYADTPQALTRAVEAADAR